MTLLSLLRKLGLLAVAACFSLGSLAGTDTPKPLVIGFVGKSQANPVFDAARAGAQDAAKQLGARYHLAITIDWRTPEEEDPGKQAEAIDQLVLAGSDAIALSCTDPTAVTEAIDSAVTNGVAVATFDSDAPKSRRFVCYAIDDEACGTQLMDELARQLGNKGVVAILGGSETALNLQARIRGVKAAAAKYPSIKLEGTFYNKETQADAADAIDQVMKAHPDVSGWVFVGGWPLYADAALTWPPGSVKCVAMGALPAELAYVRSGQVPVLFAQPYYQWGHRTVELIVDKLIFKKDPPAKLEVAPLERVTTENVEAYAKNWDNWLPK